MTTTSLPAFTDLEQVADLVNHEHAAHLAVYVDGRRVKSFSRTPARVWGTGSLSVDVQSVKTPSKITQLWIKPGATVTVEVF